jgi:hypothetical protein
LRYCFGFQTGLLTGRDSSILKRLLRLWNSAPPTPIKDIVPTVAVVVVVLLLLLLLLLPI